MLKIGVSRIKGRYGPTTLPSNQSKDSDGVTKTGNAPEDEKDTSGKDTDEIKALNGGWGWMCVIGCQISLFMLLGLMRSFAVFYIVFKDRFHGGAAATAWVGGLQNALLFLMSPIAAMLTERFSTRSVVIIGGLFCASSSILSSLAPSLGVLYFTWGVLFGIGGTLTYSPSIVIVGQYFKERRSLAMGLAASSSGIGAFAMPILVRYLMFEYGYFGAMLLQGGLLLHICISGALFRPLANNFRKPPTSRKEQNEDPEHMMHLLDKSKDMCDINETNDSNLNDIPEKSNAEKTVAEKTIGHNEKQPENVYLTLFKDSGFLTLSMAILIGTFGYTSMPVFLLALARERGLTIAKSAIILATTGASDGISRIVLGFFLDMKLVRPHRTKVYMFAIFSFAVYGIAYTLARTLPQFLIIAVLFGASESIFWVQRPVIVADLLGNDKLSSSHGLILAFQGVGVMLGPVVGGILADRFDSYIPTYYMSAATVTLGVLLFYTGRIFKFLRGTKLSNRRQKVVGSVINKLIATSRE
ncbi:unnamed protein product [Owenia fusiformis]|uniref:Uncharacterized protein n=1 Tax=Owenia fusiformis TaxID=6347 RepID=A0A8J1Y1J2_OWEFU|nr:unnamed protein product [Owenia fusiformis]